MNALFKKFVKICPKSGKVQKIIFPKGYYRLLFPILGLAALIWILIRIIPKPSRAAYPCMKVAAPMASSFLLWLIGLGASVKAFTKMKSAYLRSSYFKTAIFLVLGIGFG
jgi:hypothetical protein